MNRYLEVIEKELAAYGQLVALDKALLAGLRLLYELNAQGDHGRAQALGRRLMQLFPNEQAPWDEHWLLIARELAAAGDEDAVELIRRIVLKD